MHTLSVTWQGRVSRALLANPQPALLTGVTSRGIFIKLETDWVVFLSFERFRGPLTLNLSGASSLLDGLAAGDPVEIEAGKIRLPSTAIEVDFSHARLWGAPPPPETLLSPGDRTRALETVAGLILAQKNEPGLYLVSGDLLGLEIGGLPSLPGQFEGLDCLRLRKLLQLLQLLKTTDLEAILSALTPFLGAGAGLTPSGDDLMLGLLLAYNRWGAVLMPSFDLATLNERLNRAAAQKTTLLSANLIACATLGQADERLVEALDGMLTGRPAPEKCARNLLEWGNTSGCDALVGMALAILSTRP